jgi:hypothetical protein
MSPCIWSRVDLHAPAAGAVLRALLLVHLHARTINTVAERNHDRPSTASPPPSVLHLLLKQLKQDIDLLLTGDMHYENCSEKQIT